MIKSRSVLVRSGPMVLWTLCQEKNVFFHSEWEKNTHITKKKKKTREKKKQIDKNNQVTSQSKKCFLSFHRRARRQLGGYEKRRRRKKRRVLVVVEYWEYKGIENDRQAFSTTTKHNQQSIRFVLYVNDSH